MQTPIKILILEDDLIDADLIRRVLKKSDLQPNILHVNNVADYRTQLRLFNPDVILSDYSLPSVNGTEAFAIKQAVRPDIPFILVSGTIGEENAVELIKKGVTDYALKDKLFTLVPKIKRALKDAEDERERQRKDQKFRVQYDTLLEIASLQSHQVRAPVSSVLGLISLFNVDNPADPVNYDVLKNLRKTTVEFDNIIRQIVKKTAEIEHLEV
jgi:DNA-binding NtrC family response regulator